MKVDIIVVSEIWNYNLQLYAHLFDGYNFHHQNDPNNHASGIGVFIDSKLNYICDDSYMICNGVEYVKIDLKSHNLIMHCLYRHPGPLQNHFLTNLEQLLTTNKISQQIIIGDININLNDSQCTMVREYSNLLAEFLFYPLIIEPTRITEHSATLIDHIMYNGIHEEKCFSGNIISSITDHFPNYAFIPVPKCKVKNSSMSYVRIYNSTNITTFKEMVKSMSSNLYPKYQINHDIDTNFSTFYWELHECFNHAFPLTKQSKRQQNHKPWLNKTLLNKIK
jgi:hypothetical protein